MNHLTTQFGLGDLAYYVFRPAIYLIDWVFGSDMKHCDVCKARRALWNEWVSAPVWIWVVSGSVAALILFIT